MEIVEQHLVSQSANNERIEAFLFQTFFRLGTKKSAKKAVKRSLVKIDDSICLPGERVSTGQDVKLLISEKEKPPYNLDLKILYEDEFIAVIEKPPGIKVNGNSFKTVENALIGNLKKSDEFDKLSQPRPVHRLDVPTGGILLVAKTEHALVNCSKQFENKIVKKRYRAIAIGKIEKEGVIDFPIENREAKTKYIPLLSIPSLKNGYLTLLDLIPITGRRHQLRIHFSKIGNPILGDKEYGVDGLILKSKGLFLWAVELSFKHPVNGEDMTISIDAPPKFKTTLEREEQRWSKYQ